MKEKIIKVLSAIAKRQRVGPPGYMTRWFLLTIAPLIEVYVHRFEGGDQGRDSHDHPWLLNITIVLKGEYLEESYEYGLRTGSHWVEYGALRLGRAEHRIVETEGETWTIFVGIGRWRDWGFWNRRGDFTPNDQHKPEA